MDPLAQRRDYDLGALDESAMEADPFAQLRRWLEDAADGGLAEPNAMVLSTVDPVGTPSSRTVLLRGLDTGLCFFTHRGSRKGRALEHRADASALFPWYALQRQVIANGAVERLDAAADDAYFASRPWKSRIAARASAQSNPLASRAELEAAFAAEARAHPEDGPVPRPDAWGGYRLRPREIEFWQGRRSRMHDRLVYRRDASDLWRIGRLQP